MSVYIFQLEMAAGGTVGPIVAVDSRRFGNLSIEDALEIALQKESAFSSYYNAMDKDLDRELEDEGYWFIEHPCGNGDRLGITLVDVL